MPALFSIGQAEALRVAQRTLQPNETLLAYLDDTYILSAPNRALSAYNDVTTTLRNHTGIEPNLDKTVCWNKAGLEPPGITTLGEGVWKGNEPAVTNGVRLLGAPIGQPEYIENFGLTRVCRLHHTP